MSVMPGSRTTLCTVTAFIDWYSQMLNANAAYSEPLTRAQLTLQAITTTIARLLTSEDSKNTYHVILRLYHGWHKGWHPTDNFRAILQAVSNPYFPSSYATKSVSFRQGVEYGHTLLSALSSRQHHAGPHHLANTLRQRNRHSPWEEKMVDTALAADLLHWARESPTDWALVMAEDDDIVPPVFTAEAWTHRHGGKLILARKRRPTQFVRTDGLLRSW